MRILYGICGEGMGHATRSKVAIRHLAERGHKVLVVASDQALRVLSSDRGVGAVRAVGSPPPAAHSDVSFRVVPIVGLGMHCVDGALDLRGSIEVNARRLPAMLGQNAIAWREALAFAPDAVITDYDSFAWFFGEAHGLPVISIDNAQILPRCRHRPDVLGRYADGMRALETLTIMKAPDAHHYVVTTFFYPHVRPGLELTTTLVPPILRREVLDVLRASPPASDHVLVYKTSSLDDDALLRPLALVPEQRFIAYGLRDDVRTPPNVERRSFDVRDFLHTLATCRAVVGNGGMSLLGEALALGKPVYAVPVRGQYEQVMNASYLRQLGYGATSDTLEPQTLRSFLQNRGSYEKTIRARPQHDENRALYTTLDRLFGSAAPAPF